MVSISSTRSIVICRVGRWAVTEYTYESDKDHPSPHTGSWVKKSDWLIITTGQPLDRFLV